MTARLQSDAKERSFSQHRQMSEGRFLMMAVRCNFFKSICIIFCLVYFTELQGCTYNQYQCFNGKCISKYWKCDWDFDCSGLSDEYPYICSQTTQSPLTTPTSTTQRTTTDFGCILFQFQCFNGDCISRSWKCDGILDCSDHSDEDPSLLSNTTQLPMTTSTTVFVLSNGSIILTSFGVIFIVFVMICFAVCFRRKKRMQPSIVQFSSGTQNAVRELVPTQVDSNNQMGVVNMSHVNEPPPPYEPTVQVYAPSNDLTNEPPPNYNDLQVNLN
ncbi:low-density lipoprotein receptor class A domain-containing protein 3 isoform X3 [Hydra vulgaris]|uniref:low-density lipoprotein receptor class A domain-containing protein 3 isoform X3 n=1 Tax=Hydra vulgaris TaxID=6087 RepID=UPI0032EA44DE